MKDCAALCYLLIHSQVSDYGEDFKSYGMKMVLYVEKL